MSFKIKGRYTFTTLAPHVLGAEYRNVTVESIMSYNDAVKKRDVTTLHSILLDTIPNLPQSPDLCQYLSLVTESGESLVIAVEYIDAESIQVVSGINIKIELRNSSLEDLNTIRLALNELGVPDMVISTFD